MTTCHSCGEKMILVADGIELAGVKRSAAVCLCGSYAVTHFTGDTLRSPFAMDPTFFREHMAIWGALEVVGAARKAMSSRVKLVVAGLSVSGDKVLVQQRPAGSRLAGLWELPGGCVEDGETLRQALAREWKEELGLDVKVGVMVNECVVNISGPGNILLTLFEVSWPKGQEPKPLIGQTIAEVDYDALLALPGVPSMTFFVKSVRDAIYGVGVEHRCGHAPWERIHGTLPECRESLP